MRRFLLFFLSLILFVSCFGGGQTITKKYYVLTYTLTEKERVYKNPKFPYTVRIKRFDINFTYNRQQIVYRYSPYMLEFYNYHLWITKPAKMIDSLVFRHFKHSNLFYYVVSSLRERIPDYEISGSINHIEEYDSGDVWYAHLSINFNFVDFKTKKILVSYSFNRKQKVYKKNVIYVVRALSRILNEEVNKFVDKVNRFLIQQEQKKRKNVKTKTKVKNKL